MRMFPREEAEDRPEFVAPHPSVDPVLVQAIDTVARRLLMLRAAPYDIRGMISWTNFADVNEDDWARIEARVAQLLKELDRGEGPFNAAYKLLKARAET